jgi:predicted nucleic acid-binding protein
VSSAGGRAIHLDTSFLIRGLVANSSEAVALRGWLLERRHVAISTYAWAEFLCGPLTTDQHTSARRLAHTLVPFGTDEASAAARLFNHAGRRRGSFADCVIGATAIVAGAELATANRADFERFVGAGLALAEGA